jgi:hypothetical protein
VRFSESNAVVPLTTIQHACPVESIEAARLASAHTRRLYTHSSKVTLRLGVKIVLRSFPCRLGHRQLARRRMRRRPAEAKGSRRHHTAHERWLRSAGRVPAGKGRRRRRRCYRLQKSRSGRHFLKHAYVWRVNGRASENGSISGRAHHMRWCEWGKPEDKDNIHLRRQVGMERFVQRSQQDMGRHEERSWSWWRVFLRASARCGAEAVRTVASHEDQPMTVHTAECDLEFRGSGPPSAVGAPAGAQVIHDHAR